MGSKCSMHESEEKFMQDFGVKNWKTQAVFNT